MRDGQKQKQGKRNETFSVPFGWQLPLQRIGRPKTAHQIVAEEEEEEDSPGRSLACPDKAPHRRVPQCTLRIVYECHSQSLLPHPRRDRALRDTSNSVQQGPSPAWEH